MLSEFTTKTHGKWILSGEHAVIRGHSALVFPVTEKTLTFKFSPQESGKLIIKTSYLGKHDKNIEAIITNIILHALELVTIDANNKPLQKPALASNCTKTRSVKPQCTLVHTEVEYPKISNISGEISINSNIEAGIGMGASAALCVAIARWLKAAGYISDIYTFAKQLENFFHGQSSGLDIAGVGASGGVYFQNGTYHMLQQAWQPVLKISSCGETSPTASCIAKVQKLWDKDSELGRNLDLQMHNSTELAKSALETNTATSIDNLQQAMQQANDCFQQWGLISKPMQQHMQDLLAKGAKAVKPTGSGGGGLVVSLW